MGTRVGAVVITAAVDSSVPGGHVPDGVDRCWPIGTRWVLMGAAVASALAVIAWAGLLWRYLQPSAFRGRGLYGPVTSPDFIVYAAQAAAHVAVIVFMLAGRAGWRRARPWLWGAAAAVLAVAVYQFTRSALFPLATRTPTSRPDFIVSATISAVSLVEMHVIHLLLVLVLSRIRPAGPVDEPSAVRPGDGYAAMNPRPELGYYVDREPVWRADRALTWLIVMAAVGQSVAELAQFVVLMWVQFYAALFRSVATGWAWYYVGLGAVYALFHMGLLAGAGALLVRRWEAGRRLLLSAALALIVLRVVASVHAMIDAPAGRLRDMGAELVVSTLVTVGRVVTGLIVYALLAMAMGRVRHDRRGEVAGGERLLPAARQ